MALFENSDEERTESASSYRREEFRRKGSVALSREVLSVGLMLSVSSSLYFIFRESVPQFRLLAEKCFKVTSSPLGVGELLELRAPVVRTMAMLVLPAFGVAVVSAIVICAAQVGFYLTLEPIVPKWERIDPLAGLARIFSSQGALEGVKAILKIAIVALVLWIFVGQLVPLAAALYQKSPGEGMEISLGFVSQLFYSGIAGLAALAALDYWMQRRRLESQMKMTKREAKEEFKLREGDPLIKSRIRQIQRRLASRRMMESVPEADVVVTNPTHIAVALRYEAAKMRAPKVTAKGAGVVAEKIKELARKNGVPIVENKPLARTMFKEIEIGHMVPEELFKAVAEVLAYVYRLKSRVAYG